MSSEKIFWLSLQNSRKLPHRKNEILVFFCATSATDMFTIHQIEDSSFVYVKHASLDISIKGQFESKVRPTQFFILRAHLHGIFFQTEIIILQKKKPIKSLLEAKMCFYVHQRWLTKSTFSNMVTCVACLRSPHYDWNESESWTLFTSIKLC